MELTEEEKTVVIVMTMVMLIHLLSSLYFLI